MAGIAVVGYGARGADRFGSVAPSRLARRTMNATKGPPRRVVVGRVENLPPRSITIVPVGRFGVGVINVGGMFYALTNYCPHRGAPLCRGAVRGITVAGEQPYAVEYTREGEILTCPWHGWEFDIATGRSLAHPDKSIRTHRVELKDGIVLLEVN